MHLSPWTISTACLGFLPLASAFYPYSPPFPTPSTDKPDSRRSALNGESNGALSLPLRRVPIRRENKYNIIGSTPPKQGTSVAIDQDGSDFSYMTPVQFGTGKEVFHLLVDSAASNTWVMYSDCKSDICNNHNTFGKEDSSTLKITQNTFGITYGTGNVSGIMGSDTISLGSLSAPLDFGLTTAVSQEFNNYPMDGILGLGRLAPTEGIGLRSVMDVLADRKLIKSKLFAVHLSRFSSGVNDGELNFGEPNKARYDGDLAYSPILDNDKGFWEIPMDDTVVGGKKLGLKDRTAILDTGTSFILMPRPDAEALHKLIPGSTQNGEVFKVPCTTTTTLQLVFKGVSYNVSPKDYVGRETPDGTCGSNIIGRQTFGEKQWLVGDVFLKNVYTVFDFDGKRVGLGVKGTTGSSPGPGPKSSSTMVTSALPGNTPVTVANPTGTLMTLTGSMTTGSITSGAPTLTQSPTGPIGAPILPTGSAQVTAVSAQSTGAPKPTPSPNGGASSFSIFSPLIVLGLVVFTTMANLL